MADRNTKIRGKQILEDSIEPSDLKSLNSPSDGQVPTYDSASGEFNWETGETGGGSGEYLEKSINQSTHGFVVGNIIRYNGTVWVKAKADLLSNCQGTVGIVKSITDEDNFILLYIGYISTLSGLIAGTVYYLSDSTEGLLTSTEPVINGHVSKSLLIAVSSTSGYFFNFREKEISNLLGYNDSFSNSDLSNGILTVTHDLNQKYVICKIYDNNDNEIIPDEIILIDNDSLQIDLNSYGTISDTWNVVVISIGSIAEGSGRYQTSFDNGDLSNGILTVTHDLTTKYVLCEIYNNNDKKIISDNIELIDSSSLEVDLSSFGTISGTWNVLVIV